MTDPADHPQRYPSHHLAIKIANGDLSPDVGQQVAAEKLDSLIDRFCHNQSRNWITKLLRPSQPVTGLYIYGGVGRGKTMLMDMFVSSLPHHSTAPTVWRLHFHDFMVLAQDSIHAARQAGDDDPIESAAKMLAAHGQVLCFDEMEVRDIADAMILARIMASAISRTSISSKQSTCPCAASIFAADSIGSSSPAWRAAWMLSCASTIKS